MCFNSPYLDFVIAQVEEMVAAYDGDGAWLDIIHQGECCCTWCLAGMAEAALDPEKPEDRQEFARQVLLNYYRRMTAAIRAIKPDLPIFHNSGHIPRGRRDLFPYFTHFELESLPTGGWGYDHFPISAKYCATTGFDFLGMTGKFHTTWGEFGGYRNPVALTTESAAMLTWGSKCSVGDQLHPNGEMDADTYRLIGQAFAHVEAREPWCRGAKPVAEAAVLSVKGALGRGRGNDDPNVGAARILLEKQVNFERRRHRGRLLPLPPPDPARRDSARRRGPARQGAGLRPRRRDARPQRQERHERRRHRVPRQRRHQAARRVALVPRLRQTQRKRGQESFSRGGIWEWRRSRSPRAAGGLSEKTPVPFFAVQNPFVIYEHAQRVRLRDADLLADAWRPYFNRTFRHFCSHQHTPPSEPAGYPAALRKGSILYFAHPVFTAYRNKGQQLLRDYVWDLIAHVYGRRDLEVWLPSSGRVSLMRQEAEKRHILHLLYATPINRGRGIEVIEDIVPLFSVEVSARLAASRARLIPQGDEPPLRRVGDRIEFTVPRPRAATRW